MFRPNRNMVRQVIVPFTDPPPERDMMISIVMSSRPLYLLKMPLPEGEAKTIQPPQLLWAATVNAPNEPVPCSTSEPPTPPSQNFQVNPPVIATALPSPLSTVTLMAVV